MTVTIALLNEQRSKALIMWGTAPTDHVRALGVLANSEARVLRGPVPCAAVVDIGEAAGDYLALPRGRAGIEITDELLDVTEAAIAVPVSRAFAMVRVQPRAPELLQRLVPCARRLTESVLVTTADAGAARSVLGVLGIAADLDLDADISAEELAQIDEILEPIPPQLTPGPSLADRRASYNKEKKNV